MLLGAGSDAWQLIRVPDSCGLGFERYSCLVQVVMLGSGVPEYEQQMRRAEQERPDAFRGWVGFSIPLSHRIMAGCDILLMPSRFEPCGLNQLFAMRYGTIPIAHATGGLRDTIEDYNPFAQGKLASSYVRVQSHLIHACLLDHYPMLRAWSLTQHTLVMGFRFCGLVHSGTLLTSCCSCRRYGAW